MDSKLNLYWATTEDHDEDWFIIAENEKEAAKIHEEEEGYNPGDALAEFVLTIPKNIMDSELVKGWPTNELLKACGGEFISEESSRIIKFGEKTFCEGMLEALVRQTDDELFEAMGKGRPNNTKPLLKPEEYS